jgi:hypothetical protein
MRTFCTQFARQSLRLCSILNGNQINDSPIKKSEKISRDISLVNRKMSHPRLLEIFLVRTHGPLLPRPIRRIRHMIDIRVRVPGSRIDVRVTHPFRKVSHFVISSRKPIRPNAIPSLVKARQRPSAGLWIP